MPEDKPWYLSKTEWSAIIVFVTVIAYTTGYITADMALRIGAAAAALGLHGVRDAIGKLIGKKEELIEKLEQK